MIDEFVQSYLYTNKDKAFITNKILNKSGYIWLSN